MSDVKFVNEGGGWTLAGVIMNRGLDVSAASAWEWYEEYRRKGESYVSLLDHLRVVSRECDDIVRDLFPKQDPFYARVTEERVERLERHLTEKSE